MGRFSALLMAALWLCLSPAFADQSADEQRAQNLFLQVRCVTCQSQSIADSGAAIAHDMREMIRGEIAQGKSDEDILAQLHGRYGDAVLMKPPFSPHTALLWLAPLLVMAIGILIIARSRKAQHS
ncbi:cytochrome c-type biogenesis protein CcmH [bacterium]|nr:cytochrome c-type biogenesis protein CcmH [bacterium]